MRVYIFSLQGQAGMVVSRGGKEPDADPLAEGLAGWQPVAVEYDAAQQLQTDFSYVAVSYLSAGLAVSVRARDSLESRLSGDGILLPLAAHGSAMWLLHVTRFVSIDPDRSAMFPDGSVSGSNRPVFRAPDLEGVLVFRVEGDPRIFVTDAFLELVQTEGLTGMDPLLIWDSEVTIWRETSVWPRHPQPPSAVVTEREEEDDRVLSEEVFPSIDEIALPELLRVGYGLLGKRPVDTPVEVGEALEDHLREIHVAGRDDGESRKAVAALGFVIGDVICRAGGWEWVQLTRSSGATLAVVPADRARCVEPLDCAIRCAEDGVDGTLVGLIAGIVQGLRLPGNPGDYWPLSC